MVVTHSFLPLIIHEFIIKKKTFLAGPREEKDWEKMAEIFIQILFSSALNKL